MMHRRHVLSGLGALGASAVSRSSFAAAYPDQVIRYVVPFPPGGGLDSVVRVISDKLQSDLGQAVIVENRPGAGGFVGTRWVAKSAPDGYTVLAASFNFLTFPVLFKNIDFDIINGFEPISLICTVPMVLVVNPAVKAKTVQDLIELSKKPGKLKFGSSSTGGGGHIAGELLNQMAGIHNIHVPYKGASPMNVDLIAGAIDFAFAHITSIMEQVKGGTVRALAITANKRSPQLPDVPTMAEQGIEGFEAGELNGALFPAKTPKAIVERMNAAMLAAIKLPDARQKLEAQGAQLIGSSPQEFAEFLKTESVRWAKIARDAGLQAS